MAGLLDIGTLSGNIEISEQIAATAGKVNAHLDSIGSKFDSITKGLVVGSAAIVGALGGIAAGIVTLGEKGSTILGVEEAFDRLAVSIGQTGEALIGGLSAGVRDTVDSFELMKSANRALSAGVKLTAEDMRTLGATAREMAKAAGTDAASELDKLFSAMTTGRVRGLQLAGVMVNVRDAQAKFAASLGVTADKLNEEGRLHAVRIAILEASRKKLEQLGESQLSFKERIDQAQVAFGNWVDNLSKAIAKSPAVMKAFDDVANALAAAFGDKGQGLIDTLMQGIDAFAAGVSKAATFIGPLKDGIDDVIDTVKDFWNWLVDLNKEFRITDTIVAVASASFNFLKGAFDLVRNAALAVVAAWRQMPDWLKEIARQAVALGVGLTTVGVIAGGLAVPVRSLIGVISDWIKSFASLSTLLRNIPELYDKVAKSEIALTFVTEGSTLARWANVIATRAVEEATKFWGTTSVATAEKVGLVTLAEWLQEKASKALASTKLFLGTVIVTLNTYFQALLIRLGLVTFAQSTLEKATKALAAAKLFLGGVLLTLNTYFQAFLIRLGLTTGALDVATVSARGTTVALGALGTVLSAIPFVAAAVALKEVATQFGRAAKAEEEAAAQGRRMEFIIFIVRDMANALTFGLIPGLANAKRGAKALAEEGFDPVADAIKRIKDEATGAVVANELEIMRRAWNALTPEQRASEQAIRSMGGSLQSLIERGAKLHPEMKELRDSYKLLTGPISEVIDKNKFLKTEMDAASKATKDFLEDIVLLGQKIQNTMKAGGEKRTLEILGDDAKKAAEQALVLGVALNKLPDAVRQLNEVAKIDTISQGLLKANEEARKLSAELLKDQRKLASELNKAAFDLMMQKVKYEQEGLDAAVSAIDAHVRASMTLRERLIDDANVSFRSQMAAILPIKTAFPEVYAAAAAAIQNQYNRMVVDAERSAKKQVSTISSIFGELPGAILTAIQGGGSILQTVGSIIGKHLFAEGSGLDNLIDTGLSKLVKGMSDKVGGFVASTLAGLVPIFGAMLGPLLSQLAAAFKNLGRNVARDLQDAFATTDLGFSNLNELTATLRQMGSEGKKLASRLDSSQRREDQEATKKAIEDTRKFLAALDSDIQRYSLSWADIGDPFERMKKASQGADALLVSFDRLKGAGFSVSSITKGMAKDFNDWLKAALDAGTGIPPQIGEIIKQLVISKQLTEENARALLGIADDGMPALKDIEEAAARYGLTLDELGPKVQQLRITEVANQIVKDFELLMKAGVPFEVLMRDDIPAAAGEAQDGVAEAVAGMKKQIQDLVSKALAMGLTLPESMRPIIQRLIDAGELTDEFGEKLIDASRLQFEVPLVDRIDDLVTAIQNLIEEFKKLSPAIETEVNKGITIWGRLRGVIGAPLPGPTFTGPTAPTPPSPSAPEPTSPLFPQPVESGSGMLPSGTNITIVALDSQSAQEWLERGDNAEMFTNAIVPRIPKAVEFYQRGVGQ